MPTAYGADLSGGDVFTVDPNGAIYELTSVPTAASTTPVPITSVTSTGNTFYGATSVQDSGNCNLPAGTC
ncbi:hypothetical protein [Kitasatospora sp. GP82]|uniref:hypothetical protein n=1 Tax=Kitasatospora sp. GP82 TaxID=3035089 RepID=UPI002474F85A|nr:hypothetical protein [Kitasatospora sp. GP82]MDH6128284.1 hypothetical protein [Kitasatospora sp. GP82]